ncbi:MAG TPA: hypothetical protein DEF30_08130 [Proteiniclasticum sp.]|uniref:AP2 domain-containing protein n=1 Tax=Proteiniclasticum sp. TaxID=2053595 RepID=UPI000E8C8BCE|nr:AP2 domain-containing protein [Proteiniclasticum sp.]HBW13768.1 hypothetical protein [Proteiniclasticum sp.]
MKKLKDNLTGRTFGRLTVLAPIDVKVDRGRTLYESRCECGKTIITRRDNLLSGDTRSCGCLKLEITKERTSRMRSVNLKNGTNTGRIKDNSIQRNNTSGVRGVSWHKKSGKWTVRIQAAGKSISLGYTSNLEEAKQMRKEAEEKYFKPLLDNKD